MWGNLSGNLSFDRVSKFAQDVLNDSAFNSPSGKEKLSDDEEERVDDQSPSGFGSFRFPRDDAAHDDADFLQDDPFEENPSHSIPSSLSAANRQVRMSADHADSEAEVLQQQLDAALEEAREIRREFNRRLDAETKEKRALQYEYNALQDRNQQLERRMTHLEEEKDNASGEMSDDILRDQLQRLRGKLTEREEELATLRAQAFEQNTDANESAAAQNALLQKQIQKLEDKLELEQQRMDHQRLQIQQEQESKYQEMVKRLKQDLDKEKQAQQQILQNMEMQHEEELLRELEQQDQLKADMQAMQRKLDATTLSLRNKEEQLNAMADNHTKLSRSQSEVLKQSQAAKEEAVSQQQTLQQLKAEVEAQKSQITSLQAELEETLQNCRETQSMNGELIRDNEALEQSFQSLREQTERDNQATAQQEKMIAKLQEMNKGLLSKQDTLLQGKKSADEQLSQLQATNEELSRQVHELNTSNSHLHREIESLQSVTSPSLDTENTPAPLVDDEVLKTLQARVDELTSTNADLTAQLADASTNSSHAALEQETALRAEVNRLQSALDESSAAQRQAEEQLHAERSQFSQEKLALESQISNLEQASQSTSLELDQQLSSLRSEVEQLREEREVNRVEKEELENRLTLEKEELIHQHQTELQRVREELKASTGARDKLQQQNEELSVQLETMRENFDSFSQDEMKTKMQISALERKAAAAAATANSRIQSLQSQLQEQISQQEVLLKERIDQQQALQSLRRQQEETTQSTTEQINQLREQLDEAVEKSASLEQERDSLQGQVVELRNQEADTTQQDLRIEELERAVEKSQKQAEQLSNYLLEKDNEVLDIQEHNDTLTAEVQQLKETLSATQREQEQTAAGLERITVLEAELDAKRKECEEKASALTNLQGILEDNQAEQEGRLHTQLSVLQGKYDQTLKELNEAQENLQAMEAIRDAARRADERVVDLQEQLDGAQRDLDDSRKEVEPLRNALNKSLAQLSSFGSSEQDFVDKRLVTKLFVNYLSAPNKEKKREILQVMSRILNFSEEDEKDTGLSDGGRGRWGSMIPFFGGNANASTKSTSSNLVNLWVEFLLKESERAENEEFAHSPEHPEQ